MKRRVSSFAVSVALTLAASTPSQADPVQYSYNLTATPDFILAGNGTVILTGNSGVTTNADTNTAVNVKWFSSAGSSNPDYIAPPSQGRANYSLAVTLGDDHSTGTISFTGYLGGSLTHDSANLTNVIYGVTDGTGYHGAQNFGVIDVGNTQFTVSYIGGFTDPTPTNVNDNAFDFHIAADPQVAGGSTAPAPSSMVLSGLGLLFFGGVVYRTRRRTADLLNVGSV